LVQELSGEYAELLLAEPADSYELIGFHSGGVFALEVARQLIERGAPVSRVAVISSYPLPARVEDELFIEYLFARGAGIDPERLGYPAEAAVGRALAASLTQTPRLVPDGFFELLEGGAEQADVAAAFQRLARTKPRQRLAAIAELGAAAPDGVAAQFMLFKHALQALEAHVIAPYAGDVVLLRHSGEIALWPSMRDDMLRYWEQHCLGELRSVDVPGDHFDCLSERHAAAVIQALERTRLP
jgi:pyochelin synthetase